MFHFGKNWQLRRISAAVISALLAVGVILCACARAQSPAKPLLAYINVTPRPVNISTDEQPGPLPVEIEDPATAPKASAPTQIAFGLKTSRIDHPKGLFTFNAPANWKLTVGEDASSLFESPDQKAAMIIRLTNTGRVLDQASFEKFLRAREFNTFSNYTDYREILRQENTDEGWIMVVKELVQAGQPKKVASLYEKQGQIVQSLDYWADRDAFDVWLSSIPDLFENIQLDQTLASSQPSYHWTYEFSGKDNLFKINVPDSWSYENFQSDLTSVDRFSSPDDHASIQIIVYNDGEIISNSEAGFITLAVLRDKYPDLSVEGDRSLPNGNERLTWTANQGSQKGAAFFETRGTNLVILIVTYPADFEDLYFNLLEVFIGSYHIP